MGFIIFLVVNLMMQRVDLESEDYYVREINYEQEIIAQNNSNALEERIAISKNDDFVMIQIPSKGDFSKIEVKLLRPDDQKFDKTYSVRDTKTYLIPKRELTKGMYNIEVSYIANDKPCLQKETIYI